jgi:hypothetical protein
MLLRSESLSRIQNDMKIFIMGCGRVMRLVVTVYVHTSTPIQIYGEQVQQAKF